MAYAFGVEAHAPTTYGLVQDFQVTNSKQKATAPDESGHTADVVYYDETKNVSFTVVPLSTATKPAIGATIAITGDDAGNYTVESVTDKKTSTGHTNWTIEAMKYVDNDIPADS